MMMNTAMWACMWVAGAAAWGAQATPPGQDPKGRDAEAPRSEAAGPCEVRAYLTDKDKKPVDLREITATLTVQDKAGGKKTYPMQAVTPKASDRPETAARGEAKDIPGTPYTAELVVLRPGARHEEKAPGARAPEEGDRDPQGRKPEGPGRTGSYFKAEIPKEDPAGEGEVSIAFTIKGETRTVAGWNLTSWAMAGGHAAMMDCLAEVERHLRAHDMEKARAAGEKLFQGLQHGAKAGKGDLNKKYDDAISPCKDLLGAIQKGNRDKAMEALNKCRSKLGEAFKPGDGTAPERK
jgi:hypothetical protein